MKPQLIASLTSKLAIGVAAGTLALGSAGAVIATQHIDSTTSDSETTTTTVPESTTTTSTSTTEAPKTATTPTTDSFSAFVQNLAHDKDRDGGIGKQVSAEAHKRNEARKADEAKDDHDATEADDKDDDDTTTTTEATSTSTTTETHGESGSHRQDDGSEHTGS